MTDGFGVHNPDGEHFPPAAPPQPGHEPTAQLPRMPEHTAPVPTPWNAHSPSALAAPTSPSASTSTSTSTSTKPRSMWQLAGVAALSACLASGATLGLAKAGESPLVINGASNSVTASPSGAGTTTAPKVIQANAAAPNWTATAAAVTPSVVSIDVSTSAGQGKGSGVIIDSAGHVLTNNHVVAGAGGNGTSLQVTLTDGRTYQATVVGTDPTTDLAVIQLKGAPKDLTPISMGDSTTLKVGDPVMAVGNPLGLSSTVTTGIVSALNRPVATTSSESQNGTPNGSQNSTTSSEAVVTNAIQTSAAINPGNSGGALVNSAGQLIGINSAIASLGSSSGSQSGSIGIGFAIPVNEAKNVAAQLIANGKVQHAYLGVTTADGSGSDGSDTRAGATIKSVTGNSPASAAGLQAGDVVISVDGRPVDSSLSLVAQVRAGNVGSKMSIVYLRGGKQHTATATLAAKTS